MYIAFEGIIGTGKSTQVKRLHSYLQEKYPKREILITREPGGTPVAEAIRKVVQGQEFTEGMELICEAYLYAAARAQSLRKLVKPILDRGGVVISDRSVFSSLTNQAFGRKLGYQKVLNINREAVGNIWPDIVIFLDLPVKAGMSRSFDKAGDKFEKLGQSFYQRVARGYEEVSKHRRLKSKWLRVDASGKPDEVFGRIIKVLEPILDDHF